MSVPDIHTGKTVEMPASELEFFQIGMIVPEQVTDETSKVFGKPVYVDGKRVGRSTNEPWALNGYTVQRVPDFDRLEGFKEDVIYVKVITVAGGEVPDPGPAHFYEIPRGAMIQREVK
jgi:hypothetical protein